MVLVSFIGCVPHFFIVWKMDMGENVLENGKKPQLLIVSLKFLYAVFCVYIFVLG